MHDGQLGGQLVQMYAKVLMQHMPRPERARPGRDVLTASIIGSIFIYSRAREGGAHGGGALMGHQRHETKLSDARQQEAVLLPHERLLPTHGVTSLARSCQTTADSGCSGGVRGKVAGVDFNAAEDKGRSPLGAQQRARIRLIVYVGVWLRRSVLPVRWMEGREAYLLCTGRSDRARRRDGYEEKPKREEAGECKRKSKERTCGRIEEAA